MKSLAVGVAIMIAAGVAAHTAAAEAPDASELTASDSAPVQAVPDPPQGTLGRIGAWIEESGALVYLLAPLFMVVVAILPIPAEIPAVVNGMVFGPVIGTAITWSGAVVGASISFELSRRWGRSFGERLVKPDVLARVDRLALSAGWPALIMVRLLPTVAFTAINWAAGFTLIRRSTFLWTTAVGILPGAIVLTVSGSGLATLYRRFPALAVILGIVALTVLALTMSAYRSPFRGDQASSRSLR
jgi:uncharacterized membrane protein YdjX (TVP38/TMEM64 family)